LYNPEQLYQKWKNEFDELEDAIDLCRIQFLQTKNCRCIVEECKHFKKQRHAVFGKKIDELYNLRLKAGLQIFVSTININ